MSAPELHISIPLPDKPYSVLLVDNHPIVRLGLKTFITTIDKNAEIEEAVDNFDVISKLKHRRFDLLIIDINTQQTESFSLVAYLRRTFPTMDVLVFTTNDELQFATRFLRLGVKGFLPKRENENAIKTAYMTLRTGKTYISNAMARKIFSHNHDNKEIMAFERLTDREFEVILQILGGNSRDRISKILNLSKSTVATHKFRILKKLNVQNTVELIELFKRHKIL